MNITSNIFQKGRLILPRILCLFNQEIVSNQNFNIQKRWKFEEIRSSRREAIVKRDQGTLGEKIFDIDAMAKDTEKMFPDPDTQNLTFSGVKFADLPICYIKTSKNNTHIQFTTSKGEYINLYWTCGREGFKNCRKGTNIAAQTTAITIGNRALERGIKHVRLVIKGLGPGRASSLKGIQMTGLNIVSITDMTPISFNPPRARNARSV